MCMFITATSLATQYWTQGKGILCEKGDVVLEARRVGRPGRRSGSRRSEGKCTGGATTPQPSMLRLILNAAAWPQPVRLRPSVLGRRPRGELENETCPSCVAMAVQCASVSLWACTKRRCKTRRAILQKRMYPNLQKQATTFFGLGCVLCL